jgi:hypothetical protein
VRAAAVHEMTLIPPLQLHDAVEAPPTKTIVVLKARPHEVILPGLHADEVRQPENEVLFARRPKSRTLNRDLLSGMILLNLIGFEC